MWILDLWREISFVRLKLEFTVAEFLLRENFELIVAIPKCRCGWVCLRCYYMQTIASISIVSWASQSPNFFHSLWFESKSRHCKYERDNFAWILTLVYQKLPWRDTPLTPLFTSEAFEQSSSALLILISVALILGESDKQFLWLQLLTAANVWCEIFPQHFSEMKMKSSLPCIFSLGFIAIYDQS